MKEHALRARLSRFGYVEIAFVLVFFWCLAVQLLIPPFVGLADNGDFSRVASTFSLGSKITDGPDRFFNYFIPDYYASSQYFYRGGYFTELIPVWVAKRMANVRHEGDHFDIRWLGFLHAVLLTICFGAALRLTRDGPALVRYVLPILFIFVFSDVLYAAFLNSFYTDAVGYILFLATIVWLCFLLRIKMAGYGFWVLAGLGFGLAASRPQNTILAICIGIFCCIYGVVSGNARRFAFIASGAAIIVLSIPVMAVRPRGFETPALVNSIFLRIVPNSATPEESLKFFGLDASSVKYSGMHYWREHGPGSDPDVIDRVSTVSPIALFGYYLMHPSAAVRVLWADLTGDAAKVRPTFLGNFRKQDGFAARAQSERMSLWSGSRAFLMKRFPWVLPVFYAVALIGWAAMRARLEPLGALVPLLVFAGIIEFCAASMLDATETSRHMFIFHVVTDVLICLVVGGGLYFVSGWRKGVWSAP